MRQFYPRIAAPQSFTTLLFAFQINKTQTLDEQVLKHKEQLFGKRDDNFILLAALPRGGLFYSRESQKKGKKQ